MLSDVLLRLRSDEDGSTLLMYPLAVLMVLAIGAIAIDAAVLFQAHRQTVDVAAGLASDVAALVDESTFASSGELRIDSDRAEQVVAHANEAVLDGHPNELRCAAVVATTDVEVVCSGTGRALLLTLGGRSGAMRLEAAATATIVER